MYYRGFNDTHGHPYFQADLDIGFGPFLLGNAALQNAGNRSDANSEVLVGTNGEQCPQFGGTVNYGTNSSGNYSSTNALYKMSTSQQWVEWTQTPNIYNDPANPPPYYYNGPVHAYSAFRTKSQ